MTRPKPEEAGPEAHVTTERERIVHAAEHEIFLAFRDDEGAQHFDWWWAKTGSRLWLKDYLRTRAAEEGTECGRAGRG